MRSYPNLPAKSLIVGIMLLAFGSSPLVSADQSSETTKHPLPLEELSTFSEVYYHVKSHYVEEVDDQVLIKAAIRGMVSSLDNHSKFLDSSDLRHFQADNSGEYAGIGLGFVDHPLGIKINSVIKNSPAERQNLKEGMIITKINGIDIAQISLDDAYKLMRGKKASQVKLRVFESGHSENHTDHILTREIIYLPSVSSDLLPDNTGYLAIYQFTKKSPLEFVEALGEMSANQPIQKLIIDLRDNPGGTLESSIEIADFFVDSGILLTSSGRTSEANETFAASKITPYKDLKLVVMMNEHSASSSEILAAALQDHNKAIILGSTSYGKGSIQSIYFLQRESGLKITTAKYYSPNGHEIQDVGITPDVKFRTNHLINNQDTNVLDDLEILQAFELISKR